MSAPALPLTPPHPHTIPAADASEGVAPKAPALVRLQASRARLRDAMTPPPEPPPAPPPPKTAAQRLLQQVREVPVIGKLAAAFDAWWRSHPLRPLAGAMGQASQKAVDPLAQTHPWWLVIGAALFGALVVKVRPWRLALNSALFAGMLPQIAVQMLKRMPIESWLTLAGTALGLAQKSAAPSRAATPASPATTASAAPLGTVPIAPGARITVPPGTAVPAGMP